MQPKSGSELGYVIEWLRSCVLGVQNIRPRGAPTAVDMRERYLIWADDTKRLLRSVFNGVRLDELHTDRFWHIREITLHTARPWELINSEIEVQAERLMRLADVLEARAKRLASATGEIAVVFLHFKGFDTINSSDILSASPLRLVIPLRVVEELDEKTASRRRDLADRARSVLARLESLVGPSATRAPAPLGDQVTLEVPVDSEVDSDRYERTPTADIESSTRARRWPFLPPSPSQSLPAT